MKGLIDALNIFLKYRDPAYPTHCEHDVLWICGYTQEEISAEDTARLKELGFFYSDSEDSWQSFKYGSA